MDFQTLMTTPISVLINIALSCNLPWTEHVKVDEAIFARMDEAKSIDLSPSAVDYFKTLIESNNFVEAI